MRLTMREKRSVTAIVASRYRKATKKEKYLILGEFTQLNGNNPFNLAFFLRSTRKIRRWLVEKRKKQTLRARSKTKPGPLLKHQIPIRTFSEWDEQRPGFVEMDLVGHDGGDPSGDYIQTLDMTDVCTGWTETQAVHTSVISRVWM